MRHNTTEHAPGCTLCGSQHFNLYLETTDYFLTKERFDIYQCGKCKVLFTWPVPEEDQQARYYESEQYFSHNTPTISITRMIYDFARQIMVRKKLRLVSRQSPQGKILDIGCGTGEFLHQCVKKGWDGYGVEPSRQAREFAIGKHGLRIYDLSEMMNLSDGTFDVVTMWHSLEHTGTPADYLKMAFRLLTPCGTLVVALPNPESWDAFRYSAHWAAWDVPRHLFHFTRGAISQLAETNGFTLKHIYPLKLDAYYVCLLSERYSKRKFGLFRGSLAGLTSNINASKNNNYSSLIYIFSKLMH